MPMLEETAYISLRIKTFRNCTCSVTANSVSLLISSLNWFASLNAKKREKNSRSNKSNTEDMKRWSTLMQIQSGHVCTWAQLFEGRLTLNLGLNLTLVSLSCVQKYFLG